MTDQSRYVADGSDVSPLTRVVWKYPLNLGFQQIPLVATATLRLVDVVKGQPVLWFERSHPARNERVTAWTVRVVGTGHSFEWSSMWEHMGSARCPETGLVWHVYRIHGEPT